MRPGRHVAVLLLRIVAAHVPTYENSVDNCFKPKHDQSISQVVYLQGSGGLEIHTDQIDVAGNEKIYFDVTMRHKYDLTTFALYVGCGGCIWNQDEIVEQRREVAYQRSELEPFTQTPMHALFKKDTFYDAGALASCEPKHWTIRIVDFHNRTKKGHGTLIWGAVLADPTEFFEADEVMEFPLYMLSNHGLTWNGLPGTWWIILVLTVVFFVIGMAYTTAQHRNGKMLWSKSFFDDNVVLDPRNWLCFCSILGFSAALMETFFHLVFAQSQVDFGHQFAIGLAVVFVGNGFPIFIQWLIWRYTVYDRIPKSCWFKPKGWAFFALLVGVSWFFFFGAGFYIGPSFACLDALVRIYENTTGWRPRRLDQIKQAAEGGPEGESAALLGIITTARVDAPLFVRL